MPHSILLALSTIFAVRGGIPRFNQMFCLALDQLAEKLDFRCRVLSIDDSLEDYEKAGSPWKHLELVPCGSQPGLLRKSLAASISMRPEFLIAGILGMSPAGMLCSPFLKSGYGFFAHGFEVWETPVWSRRIPAVRAKRVFPVSRDTAGALHRSTGIPMDRMRILPNTLEPSFQIEDHQPRTRTTAEGFDLLSVARLWKSEGKKGIDTTLAAFARLAQRYPKVRYRVVGKGDDKPRLIEMAASLGIGDRVDFEEDISDEQLAQRYRECGIFVLPSGQEGFGIVFLEAMRFSKPCIGGNVGGTPEVVADGETGILVPFGDEDALSSALGRMLDDDALRGQMGDAGLQRLKDKFLFNHYRDRVERYVTEWFDLSS